MIKLNDISYKNKLIISFMLFGLFIVIIYTFFIFKIIVDNDKAHIIYNTKKEYQQKIDTFEKYIAGVKTKLLAIENSKIFLEYISDNSSKNFESARELFLNLAQTDSNIMQLRYIDNDGMENIRVDRDALESTVFSIENEKLQNKLHRYYFHDINKMKKDEIWYSKIDLNIEHNEIEKPIKPVLRAGTPVFNNGEKKGIIIVNIFMEDFLKNLIQSNENNIYLVDKDGYVIISPFEKYNWNKYLDNKSSLSEVDLESYYYVERFDFDNGEGLKLIVQSAQYEASEVLHDEIKSIVILFFLIGILAFPLAYIFSKYPAKLEKDIKEHNKYLQEKVNKAITDYDKSQKILLHQNRLAQIGEMLSMIAHQWRQPLSSINVIVTNLQLMMSLEKFDHKLFYEKLTIIDERTKNLSSTIDDFKNFYEYKTSATKISLNEIFDSSLYLLSAAFNEKNIVLNKDISIDSEVEVFCHEMKQVVLAILQNAYDALLKSENEQKIIYICAYEKDSHKYIEISDNGGGIPDNIIDDIFTPYFSTKHKKNGAGLGLYMSKVIVEYHCKGELKVEKIDHGTKFIIIV